MKKNIHKFYSFFICLWVISFVFPAYGLASYGNPYNRIIFFGDSLTDNGNLFRFDLGIFPKSPPYFQGRFTNGYVWAEQVAKFYYDKKFMPAKNYAVGGETAVLRNPARGFLPYSFSFSIQHYLLQTVLTSRAYTLFVIWIGANDYLQGAQNIDPFTTHVVNNIKKGIERLIYLGGKNFLIINLPDISKTPFAQSNIEMFHALTIAHNTKLDAIVTELQNDYKNINIHLFDTYKLFNEFIEKNDNPNDHSLPKMNTTTACWTGGYLFDTTVDPDDITDEIEMEMRTQWFLHPEKRLGQQEMDMHGFAQYIASSPVLRQAYTIDQNDTKPCENPERFLFWDLVHPTAAIHSRLAQRVIDYINTNYQSLY